MSPDPSEYYDTQGEAQTFYVNFHPFSKRVEWLYEKGGLFVSAIIIIVMVGGAVNASLKLEWLSAVLWTVFAIWVVIFFAYLIFHVVLGRRKARLFREEYPSLASVMWGPR